VSLESDAAQPIAAGYLDAGDGNQVYWEERGNPDGKPAVVLHGGPGSGAGAGWADHFDLARYRVLLFDQRGCGRSRPSVGDPATDLITNTTDHLIADLELLREARGIDRWLLLGGSWGATLGLAYAQQHPDRVSELVLFSVTTTTRDEVDWITRQMGRLFPEQWERFIAPVPEVRERGDIAAAYARLLAADDPEVRSAAARAWCDWEDTHVSLAPGAAPDPRYQDPEFRAVFARLVTHYWSHAAWRDDGELLDGVTRIAHIPAALIHGRLDISSPVGIPWRLHQRWPTSDLEILDAGHGVGLGARVRAATDRFA
jgi:proline iminopeptidase